MTLYRRDVPIADIEVWRGNIVAITFNLKDAVGQPYDLTGKTIVFRCEPVGGAAIRLESGVDFTIAVPASGVLEIELSAAQSRTVKERRRSPYEVENFTDQLTLVAGDLIGAGGVNDEP